ncbi:UNVERIFIED_CONTAM: hypothetical protein LK11_47295 [Mumia flava]
MAVCGDTVGLASAEGLGVGEGAVLEAVLAGSEPAPRSPSSVRSGAHPASSTAIPAARAVAHERPDRRADTVMI